MDSGSSSQNFIDSILVKVLILVVMFSSVIFAAKANDDKEKPKKETKVVLNTEEMVFFNAIIGELAQKANDAIANTLQHQTQIIKVIDASGKVVLETSELKNVPTNAEKLMDQGKIAFYIVNL